MASNDARAQSRQQFLRTHGWADANVIAFAADASFRRYFRLTDAGRTALLMDAPPPMERTEPFTDIANHLCALGLSAPRVYAADHDDGWLLLEDFGDGTFTQLLLAGHAEAALYELACDTLVALQGHPRVNDLPLPAYDVKALLDEAELFVQWFVPAVVHKPGAASYESFMKAWLQVLEQVPPLPPSLVLRDYHVDNLMLLPQRSGTAACGLLDFQDALHGSPAYDLASLLEDARRDVSPDVIHSVLTRYSAARPELDSGALLHAFTVLAAQRHAKVAGIFVRLWQRDGKPVYLRHIPRVLRYLRQHLGKPELAPVRSWIDAHIDLDDSAAKVQALASQHAAAPVAS